MDKLKNSMGYLMYKTQFEQLAKTFQHVYTDGIWVQAIIKEVRFGKYNDPGDNTRNYRRRRPLISLDKPVSISSLHFIY